MEKEVMADQPKPKKRQVKNPETFRERALKATQEDDKPKRSSSIKQGARSIGGPVVRPIKRTAKKLGKKKSVKVAAAPFRLLGKIFFVSYLMNSWRELKQVTWPSWKQSQRLTVAVMIFAIIFGAIVAIVDYGLDKLFRDILLK